MADDDAKDDDMIEENFDATPREVDMFARFASFCTPEQKLRGRTPQEVLGALTPEERFGLLDKLQLVLQLPDNVLEALPEEVLQKLSPATQEALRQRLKR